jgi:hypothetical protein
VLDGDLDRGANKGQRFGRSILRDEEQTLGIERL